MFDNIAGSTWTAGKSAGPKPAFMAPPNGKWRQCPLRNGRPRCRCPWSLSAISSSANAPCIGTAVSRSRPPGPGHRAGRHPAGLSRPLPGDPHPDRGAQPSGSTTLESGRRSLSERYSALQRGRGQEDHLNSRLLLHVLGAAAEFERSLILDRTRAGQKRYREAFDSGKIGRTVHSR